MSPVLVVNCGSSSLKAAVVEPGSGAVLRRALAERLHADGARLVFDDQRLALPEHAGHIEALERIFEGLGATRFAAVGHRVVHGGEAFADSVVLDDAAVEQIQACAELAPLHNPANLSGIQAARRRYLDTPHVAVFDTAFHQTLPRRAYVYAIPYELYQRFKIRRYGFHGSSHRYVAAEAAHRLGRPLGELQIVTAHLGNGCSACAIRHGESVDTTMGLTPLEGLVMGTRSGDVDPNLHQFLVDHTGRDLSQVTQLLNRESGLLGLSGTSNDMRTLLAARRSGDALAALAIEVFCYRLAKSVLALCAPLERLDALVFTGGIGEHAAEVRAETLARLAVLGVAVDPQRNLRHGADTNGVISTETSKVELLVVNTNEELVIAREALRLAPAAARSE
jgi:acetate kinase